MDTTEHYNQRGKKLTLYRNFNAYNQTQLITNKEQYHIVQNRHYINNAYNRH